MGVHIEDFGFNIQLNLEPNSLHFLEKNNQINVKQMRKKDCALFMRYYFCAVCDAQDGDQSRLLFSNHSVVSKSRINQIKHSCLLPYTILPLKQIQFLLKMLFKGVLLKKKK